MLQRLKNIYHLLNAILANICYGFPAKKMKIIAVTGTNGKTSVVQFASQLLENLGEKTGWLTTISFKIGEKIWPNKTKMTVPNVWQVQKLLSAAAKKHCRYFLLEATSHAIDQYRLWGINFSAVALTNITRDHLDYHQTFTNYLTTKLKIFNRQTPAVINIDDENSDAFIKKSEKIITYSQQKLADLNLENTMFEAPAILGDFNKSNILCNIGILLSLDYDKEKILAAVKKLKPVRGRLEMIDRDQPFKVIIDYAHTPDAFEKLYQAIKPLKEKNSRIIHVFGATGARDKGKRPLLGKIASQNADIIILTDEDPYHEQPLDIIKEIKTGIPAGFQNALIEVDRKKAIEKALAVAKPADIVLFTGKGHEEVMAVSDGTKKGFKLTPFNEKEIINKFIKSIKRN